MSKNHLKKSYTCLHVNVWYHFSFVEANIEKWQVFIFLIFHGPINMPLWSSVLWTWILVYRNRKARKKQWLQHLAYFSAPNLDGEKPLSSIFSNYTTEKENVMSSIFSTDPTWKCEKFINFTSLFLILMCMLYTGWLVMNKLDIS